MAHHQLIVALCDIAMNKPEKTDDEMRTKLELMGVVPERAGAVIAAKILCAAIIEGENIDEWLAANVAIA